MKRWFTILAALALVVLCLALIPTEAEAASSGTCGENLTWTLSENGVLTISGTGDMFDYEKDYYTPWYFSRRSIKRIIIPEGVTSIGKNAFYSCNNIYSISLPDSITKIGEKAFFDCNNLRSIVIPNGVTCISNGAFAYCTDLSNVTIPNSVTKIGTEAFFACRGLSGIDIPTSATYIGDLAFMDCENLTRITIPDSVTHIGVAAFHDCYNLTGIWVDEKNEAYCNDENGVLYNKDKTILIRMPCKFSGVYTIPNGVISIGDDACCWCLGLTGVNIPNTVTTISEGAFQWCEALTSVLIPNSVNRIEMFAFDGCDALTTVYHKGTAEQWEQYDISDSGNDCLLNATIIHDYEGDEIPVACNHQWQNATCTAPKTCTACGATEGTAGNHTYNNGVITKPATCKEEGVKTYTCTGCSATKTEDIDKSTTHTYDNACDAICNVCAGERTVSHDYQTAWSKDKTGHWHVCSVCKDKKDVAAHTPGPEATETTAQTCTVCGYVLQAALNHTHDYADTWTMDENGHWHTCSGCEEQGDYAAHTPGAAATETTAQTCTACGYEIAPALGVPETRPSVPATEPETQPVTQPESKPAESVVDNEPSADPTLWIVIAVGVVLGIGIAAVIIWKKKH